MQLLQLGGIMDTGSAALSERTTLADNATTLDWQIRKSASMFMSTPDNAWQNFDKRYRRPI